MTSPTSLAVITRQRRLRSVVKRLVIELAHLEVCLAEGIQDADLQAAATGIDTAIDQLNDYLARNNAAHRVA